MKYALILAMCLTVTPAWADAICSGNPKTQLEVLLNSSAPLALDDFKKHIKTFNYEEFISQDEFTSYVCFQDSPIPWPEVILFFHKKILIAIFGPPLVSKRITATTLLRGAKVSYVGKITPELRKQFESIHFPFIEQAN